MFIGGRFAFHVIKNKNLRVRITIPIPYPCSPSHATTTTPEIQMGLLVIPSTVVATTKKRPRSYPLFYYKQNTDFNYRKTACRTKSRYILCIYITSRAIIIFFCIFYVYYIQIKTPFETYTNLCVYLGRHCGIE